MKRWFIISTVMMIWLGSAAICVADIQDGFLGTKWGDSIDDLSKFDYLYSKNKVDYYTNPDEVHVINDIEVPNVIYGFISGKLFAVYISVESLNAYVEFQRYMTGKYGVPKTSYLTKAKQRIERWKYKDIKIKLKYNLENHRMKLAFYHQPLAGEAYGGDLEKEGDSRVEFWPTIKEKKKPKELMPLLTF